MVSYLKFIRRPYEEPYHLHLFLTASKGPQMAKIDFYTGGDTIADWAKGLEVFPQSSSHVYLWEYGSERPEDKSAYYLRIRAFVINSTGLCALHLRFNNNKPLPERELSEFCIGAEAAAINRLSGLFREFGKLEHEVLIWTPTDGELFKTEAEAQTFMLEQCSGT